MIPEITPVPTETDRPYLPVGSICENYRRSRNKAYPLYEAARSVAPDRVRGIGQKLELDNLLATDYDEICADLFQILRHHTPPFCYLGSQAAAYLLIGVWLDFDAIQRHGMRLVEHFDSNTPLLGEYVVTLNDDGVVMICTRDDQGEIQIEWQSK